MEIKIHGTIALPMGCRNLKLRLETGPPLRSQLIFTEDERQNRPFSCTTLYLYSGPPQQLCRRNFFTLHADAVCRKHGDTRTLFFLQPRITQHNAEFQEGKTCNHVVREALPGDFFDTQPRASFRPHLWSAVARKPFMSRLESHDLLYPYALA